MADFEPALKVVLRHEGGDRFTDRPGDRGGPTKYGITAATLGRWRHLGRPATADEVKSITWAEAAQIYKIRFWDACLCSELGTQDVATKVMDLSVNQGPLVAGRILQAACNRVAGAGLTVDGIIGRLTIDAVRRCEPRALLVALCAIAKDRYLAILDSAAARGDTSQERFRAGWLKRAQWDGETPA